MSKINLDTHQRHYFATIIGGTIGAFLALALGVPLGALLVLACAATAYALGWRIQITRKQKPDQSPNA